MSYTKFVLATTNRGKLRELREMLTPLSLELMSPDDLGIELDVDESGATFEDNARLKARAYCAATGLPAIADDSGLCVDAMNGAPGVYSARFGGLWMNPHEHNIYLLGRLDGVTDRAAHFACAIVCAFPDGSEITAAGECRGEIAAQPRGEFGFGYDPIFVVSALDRTMAELNPEEKHAISHRGNALRAFIAKLTDYKEL
ncbi:MAG: RdgB/HAM1 family non-canonical purine NTP pyrophosphatase [Oscillospiraceae bacterium]|nr:RdgB/HAM1 family non-canonical purine NTP pyrophosphatase [Oscillospiraceae bacterium]